MKSKLKSLNLTWTFFQICFVAFLAREAVLALACRSEILVVAVLTRATVLALDVLAFARLNLAVGALVAFGTLTCCVQVLSGIAWHTLAAIFAVC